MAEQEGYVKLNRNILHWKWVTSCTTGWLFIILLLKANYKEMEFKGVKIHPGQLVTSYQTLCESTGLTLQQCRTAINRLKSTGEITTKPYHNFQVITIVNYKKYQDATGKSTSKQQASNRQTTSKQQQEKEYKEGKKERKKEESRFAPTSPSGTPPRGTDEFRAISHLLLGRDEGTVDDIPFGYRDICHNDFSVYWGMRNQ